MDDPVPVHEQAVDRRDLSRILAELRQWHVFRIAAAYGVVSWLIIQVVATVGPAFDMPAWVLRAVVLAAIAGFLATMSFLLFRPRSAGKGHVPTYLSRRARLIAGAGVLLVAAAAASFAAQIMSAREEISLAVLPFADLSPQRDKAYFAEGVAEEILGSLSAEKGIKVLGRTSARQIERSSDPQQIRSSLGVTHILEGSTRTAGNDLRVNVRLIDTADGSRMWEEEYRGALSDVFNVQDNIASAVAKRLRGTFFNSDVKTTAPAAVDAYETYLAARAIIRQNKAEAVKRAWQMARELVEAHPEYAAGHSLLSDTTMLLTSGPYSYGGIPKWKARQLAMPHAREAIRLAPNEADGYASLGLLLPAQQGIGVYQKALKLDPSRTDVRLRLALALDVDQQPDKAFEQYKLIAEMDPLAPAMVNRYVQILASSGQTREAREVVEKFAERGGSPAHAWRFRGAIYGYLGDFSQSFAARRHALQIDPGLPYQHEWIASTLNLLRLSDRAVQYRSGATPYLRSFIVDDRGALKARLAHDGAAAWDANGSAFAVFSAGRSRDWEAITRFYDVRPAEYRDYCTSSPALGALFAVALQQVGRRAEADHLIDCKQRQLDGLLNHPVRSPDLVPGELEFERASLLAVRSDARALPWLAKALDRGWVGQYFSSQLSDWPQFDRYRTDQRLTAIQKRIDSVIARERAEVLSSR